MSKTYQETLVLIEENKSLADICNERNLTLSTIISHLHKLQEHGAIDETCK